MNTSNKHKYKRVAIICSFYHLKVSKDHLVLLIINLTININKTTKIKIDKKDL